MKAIMRDELELQDSGTEWLGKIPVDWNIHRIKNNYSILSGSGFKPALQGKSFGDYPVCKASDISNAGKILLKAANYIDKDDARSEHFNIIPANSIIFAKIGEALKKNNRTIVAVDCCVDNNCQAVVPMDVSPIYSYYLYSCLDMGWFDNGGAIPSLNNQKLRDLKIPYPNSNEQQRITNYLDDRCSKIDAIIAEAKASIEEYKELKQAVIYEAVTKGLDKNVEMKDSGVPWLDDIPANWHLVKITRILDKNHPYAIGDGDHGSIKTDQYLDCGIPFIRVQNLGWGTKLNLENVVYISEEDNRQIQNSTLKPDDILFAKTGATIGKTAIIPKDVPVANTTSHVGKITISKEHNPRYVFYVLSSQVGYRQFWDIALQKTTRPELSIEETKSIKVILPNDRELEDKIVKFLDEKIPVFDELINTKQSLIEDLESYKKSLIYEVVTGKRKVVE